MEIGYPLEESEFELTSRLLRSLVHRVRGDLSVITNDLAYLGTHVDSSELERSRARCASIAHRFSILSALPASPGREHCSVSDVATIWSAPVPEGGLRGVGISVDVRAVRYAVKLIFELFGAWRSSIWIESDATSLCVCELRFQRALTLQRSYGSFSALVAAELGESAVVEGCLIDLVLRDHGWSIVLSNKEETLIACVKMDCREGMVIHD